MEQLSVGCSATLPPISLAAAPPPQPATASSIHHHQSPSQQSPPGGLATASKGSSHAPALRSLGILQELQEFVAAALHTQQRQERELGKLKAEKRQVERALKQQQRPVPGAEWQQQQHAASPYASAGQLRPSGQAFQASEIADLPPRLRALVEDSKVLKESARRYKQRAQDAERHTSQLEQQLASAQAANSKLRARLLQLEEGSPGREEAAREAALARSQVQALASAAERLQHAHQVLQAKLDTDTRLHKQAAAAAARDRQQLEQQIQQLHELLAAKDKEARALALDAKQAQRKLADAKAAAARAMVGASTRIAEAVQAAEARAKAAAGDNARVHLMLCILHDSDAASATREQQQQHPASRSKQHLLKAGRDDTGSRGGGGGGSASGGGGGGAGGGCLTTEQAAVKLQAGARGFLARRHLARQRERQHASLMVVQASTSGHTDVPVGASFNAPWLATALLDGAPADADGAGATLPLVLPTLPLQTAAAEDGGAGEIAVGVHELIVRSRQRVGAAQQREQQQQQHGVPLSSLPRFADPTSSSSSRRAAAGTAHGRSTGPASPASAAAAGHTGGTTSSRQRSGGSGNKRQKSPSLAGGPEFAVR